MKQKSACLTHPSFRVWTTRLQWLPALIIIVYWLNFSLIFGLCSDLIGLCVKFVFYSVVLLGINQQNRGRSFRMFLWLLRSLHKKTFHFTSVHFAFVQEFVIIFVHGCLFTVRRLKWTGSWELGTGRVGQKEGRRRSTRGLKVIGYPFCPHFFPLLILTLFSLRRCFLFKDSRILVQSVFSFSVRSESFQVTRGKRAKFIC